VVGVGRVIFPLAYNVNERFNVGGSVDVVWADGSGGGHARHRFGDDSDFTWRCQGWRAAVAGFTYKPPRR
jgi:long-chain fatty acid transport protein